MKTVLTIAGLDPSGGAGIIADIKTFTAFGCFAAAAVSSLTFQNTQGVFGAISQTAETIRGQVRPVMEDFEISAVKTGMLPTKEVIEETAALLREANLPAPVVDPVVRSTSGFDLIDDDALRSLIKTLFPLAVIVTPNLPEAERIARAKIDSLDSLKTAARQMLDFGAKNVLIKGGHLNFEVNQKIINENLGDVEITAIEPPDGAILEDKTAYDFLFDANGVKVFSSPFIHSKATHGTGCTLAAAIAANLANGLKIVEAVRRSKAFVSDAIAAAPRIGHGHSPVNHAVKPR